MSVAFRYSSIIFVLSITNTGHLWSISIWCYTQNCTCCRNCTL